MGHDVTVTVASAIEQLPFILAVCEGPDLRVVAYSAATQAVMPGRDVLGKPMRELIQDLRGQQFVDAYYQVYRSGEPVSGQEWRVHLDMPDGEVLELWVNFTIVPWRDAGGGIRGVIGSGFDVTESVKARLAAVSEAEDIQVRLQQSRDVVNALQRELLPAGLPVLPGAQIAASYLLADADTSAGGDWFDAVTRSDGTVALMVGDVVGHGVTASGVMGQLRAVLRDRLDTGADIAEALGAADRFARRLPAAHATTVCLAVLDQADGTLSYCTAGHPPPLVVNASGETRFLPGTGGTPLAPAGRSRCAARCWRPATCCCSTPTASWNARAGPFRAARRSSRTWLRTARPGGRCARRAPPPPSGSASRPSSCWSAPPGTATT